VLSALTDFLGDLFSAGTMPAPAPTLPKAKPRAPRRAAEPVEQIALDLVVSKAPVVLSEAKDPLVSADEAAVSPVSTTPGDVAAAPRRDAPTLLADLRVLGLTGISTLRLTRNRTVMVSWRGTQLRVHQGFAQAPQPILRAIVQFVTARRPAERTAAVRALRAFELPEQAPRAPRRLSTSPEDRPIAERLTQLHRTLNADRFGGRLKPVEIVVSRRMKTRLGHYALAREGVPGQIAISRRHLRRHGWQQAAETLLHEMVHQWQDELGMAVDHGAAFRRKAKELGITPAARRAV
jgi:hypothetical protein